MSNGKCARMGSALSARDKAKLHDLVRAMSRQFRAMPCTLCDRPMLKVFSIAVIEADCVGDEWAKLKALAKEIDDLPTPILMGTLCQRHNDQAESGDLALIQRFERVLINDVLRTGRTVKQAFTVPPEDPSRN